MLENINYMHKLMPCNISNPGTLINFHSEIDKVKIYIKAGNF